MNIEAASHTSAVSVGAIRQRFRPVLGVVVVAALLLWFSIPTFVSIHWFWLSEYYSHGYLVLLLTAFLFGLEVRRAPLEPFTPSWAGLACLIPLVLLMVAGQGATTVIVSQSALPALWIAAIWSLAGIRNARRFAPSLAYLYVAIPVWHVFVGSLQSLTIFVVSAWIRAAHLPAFIEGNFFHVPSGTFEVEEGCAGLRQAIVALALAFFVSLLRHRRLPLVVLLTASGLALALVGNWLRVFTTIVVGLSPGSPLLLVVRDHHYIFGWTTFVVVMVPFFFVVRLLDRLDSNLPAAIPVVSRQAPVSRMGGMISAACVVLVLGILLNYRVDQGDEPLSEVTLQLPETPGWTRVGDWQGASRPDFVGATATAAGQYSDGDGRVGVFGATYAVQQQGHEVIYSKNTPEGQSGTVVERGVVKVTAASGVALPFQELRVSEPDLKQRLVWVGVRTAGESATGAVAAKALQLLGALRGRHDAQALVLSAPCSADCATARSSLSKYATAAGARFYDEAELH